MPHQLLTTKQPLTGLLQNALSSKTSERQGLEPCAFLDDFRRTVQTIR